MHALVALVVVHAAQARVSIRKHVHARHGDLVMRLLVETTRLFTQNKVHHSISKIPTLAYTNAAQIWIPYNLHGHASGKPAGVARAAGGAGGWADALAGGAAGEAESQADADAADQTENAATGAAEEAHVRTVN